MERECDYCQELFEVYDEKKHGYGASKANREIKTVCLTDDPYQSEINDDWTQYWLCEECYRESADDI